MKAPMAVLTALRVMQFRAAYNLPVQAGIDQGIFAKHGLEIAVEYTPGSDFLIGALESGACDIGHTAADDVVAAVQGRQRSELFLFMGLHSGLLSVVAGPEYPEVGSLKGQRLGVDSTRTGFVFLLQKFLRFHRLAPQDYSLIEIGGWEERCRALLNRRIAATLLTQPYLDDAARAGCRVLARGHEIQSVYQATCGAARRAWANDHRTTLVDYIRAYIEATRWCFDPANRRACLSLLSRQLRLDDSRGEKTLAELLDPEHGLYPDAALNVQGLAAVLALRAEMRPDDPTGQRIDPYSDLSFYREAIGGAPRRR